MTHKLKLLIAVLSFGCCSACDAPYGPPIPLVTKEGVTEAEKNQDIIDCHAGYREDFGDNRPTYDALARQDARHAKVSETGFIEAQDAGRTNA